MCNCVILNVLVSMLLVSAQAATQEKVVYSLNGITEPVAGLTADQAGNLYGTAEYGGVAGSCGGVFELSPDGQGKWSGSVLYEFTGAPNDGCGTTGRVIVDSSGNLFGTVDGGLTGWGGVFELSPDGGGHWTEKIIYTFQGKPDGCFPQAGLVLDAAGNLYGTTELCGSTDSGTVFELTPNTNGSWTETVLYNFDPHSTGEPNSAFLKETRARLPEPRPNSGMIPST